MRPSFMLLVACLGFGMSVPDADGQNKGAARPITGKAGPGLEALDEAVLAMMNRHGIPGASLALAKEGRLVLARGYGWADLSKGLKVEPGTLFALSSLSKPITALAILLLIEQGKLRPEDVVWDLLPHIRPPRGSRYDTRVTKITVRQCLNHSGGWNRNKSGDPCNWSPQIGQALGVKQPIDAPSFISFMWTVPLDFEPGAEAQYSNVGYIMLGAVVEKVSGQSYEAFIRQNVLEPMGLKRLRLHQGEKQYMPGEAIRYFAGTDTPMPPLQRPFLNAAGGWSASAVDMARFLTALDGSRGKKLLKEETFRLMLEPPPPPIKLRANNTFNGNGWFMTYAAKGEFAYFQDGLNHGSRAFMKRNAKGLNWVLMFNASMEPDSVDFNVARDAVREVREEVERLERYPHVDLFKEFP